MNKRYAGIGCCCHRRPHCVFGASLCSVAYNIVKKQYVADYIEKDLMLAAVNRCFIDKKEIHAFKSSPFELSSYVSVRCVPWPVCTIGT